MLSSSSYVYEGKSPPRSNSIQMLLCVLSFQSRTEQIFTTKTAQKRQLHSPFYVPKFYRTPYELCIKIKSAEFDVVFEIFGPNSLPFSSPEPSFRLINYKKKKTPWCTGDKKNLNSPVYVRKSLPIDTS